MGTKAFPWKEFLQRHPIFATVRDEKRIDALLAEGASWERVFAKDDDLLRQGDVGGSVFMIGAGSAEVVLEARPDTAPVILAVMRRGEVFGEMALLEHRTHSATVRAKETCTVLEVRGSEFESLMADYPDIEFKLLLKMSERLRNVGDHVLGGQIGNVEEKLKMFALKLDTEQKLVDCALRAAQAMFDQTKLRADEVISSAERSRDRLQKMATLVTALAGIVITILGAFGFKQIWDVSQTSGQAHPMA